MEAKEIKLFGGQMLRNRSKGAVSSKQGGLMAPTRFFNVFSTKTAFDAESLISPKSILDSHNPFGYDKNLSKPTNYFPEISNKLESEGIGLALIDSFDDQENISRPIGRMILFNVKIPCDHHIHPSTPSPSDIGINTLNSPSDFGMKTRISSPNSGIGAPQKALTKQLSLKEMELSEDYTCVITRGPNPKTTRIFDNCIVESSENVSSSPSMDFLCFCYTCKDSLGQGKDIYMYKGEKAFCSHECRCQEMFSEEMKNQELDYSF